MTNVDNISIKQLEIPKQYTLYYISTEGKSIYSYNFDNKQTSKLMNIDSTHNDDRLFVRKNQTAKYDLYLHLHSSIKQNIKEILIKKDFSTLAGLEPKIAYKESSLSNSSHFNFGLVPKLTKNSIWQYKTDFWSTNGIEGTNTINDKTFKFSLDTPFISWRIRNATHIDKDGTVKNSVSIR